MNTLSFPTSACRLCRYYQPEGRRGGVCQQLGVPVRGSWSSCSLALPPFAPSWESIEDIWPQDHQQLSKQVLAVDSSLDCSLPKIAQENNPATVENLVTEVVLV
jgi:hypothetical protein